MIAPFSVKLKLIIILKIIFIDLRNFYFTLFNEIFLQINNNIYLIIQYNAK